MSLYSSIQANTPKCDASEKRALVFAAVISLVFVAFLGVVHKSASPRRKRLPPKELVVRAPAPVIAEEPRKLADPNAMYRWVPPNFSDVDFQNRSYGQIGGLNLNLTLVDGERAYPNAIGGDTFFLEDVYYTDVTGDGTPEAIVHLSRVQCGASCDGGSALLYVYASGPRGLKRLWQYETGSMAYGCGLKSLTLAKKEIVLEMFGQCMQNWNTYSIQDKFLLSDTTRVGFQFNGDRFVKRQIEVITSPVRDLRAYSSEIIISE